jgi:hypothetical protein
MSQSTFEWRHHYHWDIYARKARLSAFALWQMLDETELNKLVDKCGYENRGDADHAIMLAFRRESCIALELVIKAVIAQNLRNSGANPAEKQGQIPMSHDLPKLWQTAGLLKLPVEDQQRLLLGKSVLMWSGRYATPTSEKNWTTENKEMDKLRKQTSGGKLFSKPTTISWSDFDRLFKIAETALTA